MEDEKNARPHWGPGILHMLIGRCGKLTPVERRSRVSVCAENLLHERIHVVHGLQRLNDPGRVY